MGNRKWEIGNLKMENGTENEKQEVKNGKWEMRNVKQGNGK